MVRPMLEMDVGTLMEIANSCDGEELAITGLLFGKRSSLGK